MITVCVLFAIILGVVIYSYEKACKELEKDIVAGLDIISHLKNSNTQLLSSSKVDRIYYKNQLNNKQLIINTLRNDVKYLDVVMRKSEELKEVIESYKRRELVGIKQEQNNKAYIQILENTIIAETTIRDSVYNGLFYHEKLNKLMILDDLTYVGEFDNLSSNTEGTNE